MKELIPFRRIVGEINAVKKLTGEDGFFDENKFPIASRYLNYMKTQKSQKKPSRNELAKFEVSKERWERAKNFYSQKKDELIKLAQETRNQGVSHRDPPFQVGTVILGIKPTQGEDEYSVSSAYNFTLKPGAKKPNLGKGKRCAERGALEIAEEYSKNIVAIVSVSREIDTGDGNKSSCTLLPCAECQKLFKELLERGLLRADTIVCTVNDLEKDNLTIEERTVGELLNHS